MSQNSYDYASRKGIQPISWEHFHGLCKGLARAVAPFRPQIILPVVRGGAYPGMLMAHILRVEVAPIRLSRRVQDQVQHDTPQWLVEPPEMVKGQRVLIVDEISSTGETIRLVKEKVTALGAKEIRSAVLYAHTGGVGVPDYIGLISDALLLNPWDREIYSEGGFAMHPEYAGALAQLGVGSASSLLIDAPEITPAKGGDHDEPGTA